MAVEDILVSEIYQIGLLVKGLGIFALAWIAYAVMLFIIEKKKMNKLNELGEEIKKLGRKIDNLISKKK